MNLRTLLSNLLFLIGFAAFMFMGFLLVQRLEPQSLAFASAPASEKNITHVPSSLYIPLLAKTLRVYPSSIKNGEWETTDKGVSYLTTSGIPGRNGNAVFYGHNFPALLGDLGNLQVGSVIILQNVDGTSFKYTVIEKKIVKPSDTGILASTPDSRITVYTCTGFLDSERLVVVASLDK